jgi:Ca2+/H+ antiporter
MPRGVLRVFVSVAVLAFAFSCCTAVLAARVETLMGTVVKQGSGFVIEADDGDYILKGKNLSKLVGKLVEVTGTITRSDKGEVIEVKSIQELEETEPE